MLVTTTMDVECYQIVEYKGIVRGIIVRAPTILQGWWGSLKNVVGGNIGAYTNMCEQARLQAYQDMVDEGRRLGANAIIGMRYDSSAVGSGTVAGTEVLCYGTAVIVERIAK